MAERFFATKQIDGPGPTHTLTLLSGPPSCGKTSLLFQYALNCATASNGKVVFICNRRRLENNPPFLSQGTEPSLDALQRIQMKYLEDDDGLKKYFASFHLHDNFPSAVIIDDFGDFFPDRNCQDKYGNARGRDLAMVRSLALCRDAITHANEKLQSRDYCSESCILAEILHYPSANFFPLCSSFSEKLQSVEYCKLVIADTHQGDSPRLLFIYKRWIQCIFTIQELNNSRSFLLRTVTTSGGRAERMRTAKYSIALQYLVLEEMSED
ncbi:uncharacterized protein LOC109837371 isoform X1 [Asparagus officinalis]|uniref:uncharacterized protein LOC109837371 isoform X1 n=1 Tax=Asparagus officinalis TaxID=4686 RepID=UPI00098E5EAC|nr:uncharacterized protein LOC109837371 isoform X1 [Asparagus officinalis]XP_020261184.1 uncharacterized protein LOC109837371 isoform X1 [Asparagus officinalis]